MPIDHALFERNDRIVRDGDVFRAYLRTALCNVAISNSVRFFQFIDSIRRIERVQLQCGDIDKKPWTDELFMHSVIAEDVAHVLAQETLDAFTKFLNAIHILLCHAPGSVLVVGWTGLEFLDPFFDLEVP